MKILISKIVIAVILAVIFICCKKEASDASMKILFEKPQKVSVINYDDHVMEPFISRDGRFLFFNNLNNSNENTDLHYASRVNDTTFEYIGKLDKLNTEFLDGVPSADINNIFYFISLRSYNQTSSTIFRSDFLSGNTADIELVPGIEKNSEGWVNFDSEISCNGNFIFFSKGKYDSEGGPYEADIFMSEKINDVFQPSDGNILQNINTGSTLEYAACTSSDLLELYFTRVISSMPRIFIATRNSIEEPFQMPYMIEEIEGFAEAPALSPDNKIVYYHKLENDRFVLYMVRKAYKISKEKI